MAITNAHLHWFKLKCPYPQGSKAFRMAKAKLDNATYADLERLRTEFELYKDGSILVTHYSLYDEWFESVGGVKTEQVNMKGIQRHGSKFRVQKRINGLLQRWTFDTLDKAVRQRDAIFAKIATE
jgi:hypothetical protein